MRPALLGQFPAGRCLERGCFQADPCGPLPPDSQAVRWPIDPRRGGGVRKHSALHVPFLTWSPLLICPQHEMPSSRVHHLPLVFQEPGGWSGDQEVSSGSCLALRPNWEDWGGGRRGVLPGVVSPWPAALWAPHTAHSPALDKRCTGWLWELSPGTMEPFKQPGLCTQRPSWSLSVARRCVGENVCGGGGSGARRQRDAVIGEPRQRREKDH